MTSGPTFRGWPMKFLTFAVAQQQQTSRIFDDSGQRGHGLG